MAYIIKRKDLHYVVAYDGVDPITGRERRRWHPAGADSRDAESLLARLDGLERTDCRRRPTSTRFGEFLTDTWLPRKRSQVRATTAHRYGWLIDHYLAPYLGDVTRSTGSRPTISTTSTTTSSNAAAIEVDRSRPRPCTRRT